MSPPKRYLRRAKWLGTFSLPCWPPRLSYKESTNDFGFIEPALLAAIAKTAKGGQAAPKGIEGALVTRVVMGVDVMARLHQQIQQVLVGLRDARQPNP